MIENLYEQIPKTYVLTMVKRMLCSIFVPNLELIFVVYD